MVGQHPYAAAGSDLTIPPNLLLGTLPATLRQHLVARLEHVPLPRGMELWSPGEVLRHVYFPTSGLVSLAGTSPDGGSVELAAIGHEGVLGLSLILQGDVTVHGARVQVAGAALRLHARELEQVLRQHQSLQRVLLRWTHRLVTDISQAVVCHRYHHLMERLCSYLLRTADQLHSDSLPLTHEAVAQALGVLRKTVTAAAVAAHDAGAIRYRHGRIVILDRSRLERSACGCYVTSRARRSTRTARLASP